MLRNILIIVVLLAISPLYTIGQVSKAVYLDDAKPLNERIEDALSRMTVEEKVNMLHAQSKFSSAGVPRLGIPELWTTDGPHGIRPEVLWDEWNQAGWTNDSSFAFPALTCLAATWNEDISYLYGKSLGEEARYRKKDVLLGPGVNIYRSPLNGRNFEYMGEDPYLASEMVVPYIHGVQENGVAACVKHFALNNQETDRFAVDVIVDDRALYEIYLPAFKAAVQKGNAWAIMGAYNKYKGIQCCHNPYLLIDILRKEWGFKGTVYSDWGGVHNTREAIFNGLDIEFGTWIPGPLVDSVNFYNNFYLAKPYLDLIYKGEVGTKELDDKVRNILKLIFLTSMNKNRPFGSMVSEEHSKAGLKIAQEGIVLLKNTNNLLPIDLSKTKKIAVIGENAVKMMTVGGGSSSLKVKYEISPLDGLKKRVGKQVEVIYARGYVGENEGEYDGVKANQDISESRPAEALIEEACNFAKDADYVIFFGGLNKNRYQDSEDSDRKSLALPYNQDNVISALSKVNKNLIVVNISGNAVSMPWVNEVPVIIQGWFLGSESGTALASVLVGDINPSGKLPFTFPVKLEDNSAHSLGEFPGKDLKVSYTEGIYVGYRWFDLKNIKPLFSFGHGLSYTTFEYDKLNTNKKSMALSDSIIVSVNVKNTGKRQGSEVVQLYISDLKSSLPRPVKELKGFEKITLQPGETKTVSFTVNKSDLSFFDPVKHDWVAEPGDFEAIIGSSSSDIRGKAGFNVKVNP
ncbi:MAG: glycoside hydrolase family 3 C-terminal domain-containing protein [Prolixibacteraceae bacterium]|nr:glycoside hydrolase family 3 C-terminal domain-containing protein [Prolixibacteraceae bacterium]